ncbi:MULTISPECIES: sensor histidine kinase [unclassified Streptomyces]|uniref:sensor histidine kinase n=1 Tax=unclassified Streptomyces TaxID=2593676 RepID=UPI002E2A3B90|nr:ATP-binding protein [Streptomyces sp. NBC_00223]
MSTDRADGSARAAGGRLSFAGGRHGRATVQVWFNLVLGVMVLLVLVFAVIGARLLSRTSEISDTLSRQVQPARVEGVRLQTALLDQETGVRGFVLTHDDQFLAPYTEGLSDEETITARLRVLIGENDRALGDLDALQNAARQWREQYAEPLITHSRQGRPTSSDSRMLDGSRRAFDGIRALYAAEDRHLLADRVDCQAQLRHVNGQRDAVFLAMLASFLVAALVLALLLRQIVGRPLVRLRDSALLVAGGDFGNRIEPSGPADLRVVAEAVESMRLNLAGALAEAHDQRGRLSEQAVELTAQAEELRRSNSELEQFAYVASHDLQEPLRKVASFCQLLEKRYRDQLDERGVQYIQFAVDGAKRMQILITDLLAFSRVGRTQDDRLPVRLDAALDTALANLSAGLEESGARVVRPDALPGVTGDPTLLTMLWQNLIGNAVKFRSADRPPLITVETGTGPDGEHTFAVTDNGIGIPPEFGEKVFVIFQRLHSRDVYDGTGIGLALCRKIVEHHGGRIALDTSYTGGTRIRFTLPAAPDEEPPGDSHGPKHADTDADAHALDAGPGREHSEHEQKHPDEGAHPA